MRVAIISNGPSAVLYPGREGYDAVLAVNWTLERWDADWWVFADFDCWPKVSDARRRTVARIFTRHDIEHDLRETVDTASGAGPWVAHGRPKAAFKADLKPLPPIETQFNLKYSGCFALWLAWHLGATDADCYGVDLGGLSDWRGTPAGMLSSRRDERWARERETWFAMCKALAAEGMGIRMARMLDWREGMGLFLEKP